MSYPTRKALENLINDLTDDLAQYERGDPAAMSILAKIIKARQALKAHNDAIKQCEDEAR